MYIPFQNILKLKKSADFDRQVGTFSLLISEDRSNLWVISPELKFM